ncbi:hypothetical protein XM38_004540 [Halomicronema hongdechloris C2206]|uniref:Uncharacterized protein n=1 Tax=Halomicronema hongdechloris C2206 TaxID=1641165 RepID=A0A1Z3HH45_9CYAN|nr:hypothetical protein XM38_004540 [Halomicronema hongdechloris C2206]
MGYYLRSSSTTARVWQWWDNFCNWITSTRNRIYIDWFGVLMIPEPIRGPGYAFSQCPSFCTLASCSPAIS